MKPMKRSHHTHNTRIIIEFTMIIQFWLHRNCLLFWLRCHGWWLFARITDEFRLYSHFLCMKHKNSMGKSELFHSNSIGNESIDWWWKKKWFCHLPKTLSVFCAVRLESSFEAARQQFTIFSVTNHAFIMWNYHSQCQRMFDRNTQFDSSLRYDSVMRVIQSTYLLTCVALQP